MQPDSKKNKKTFPLLPPGFRTLRWWKMLTALFGYFVIIFFPLNLIYKSVAGSIADLWIMRLWIIFLELGVVLICANYAKVNELFRFAKLSTGLRMLSKILQCALFFGIMILVLILAVNIAN